MRRPGLSLSLNYVVLGLIALAVAALVLLYVSGNLGTFQGIVGDQMTDSEKSLAESACRRKMADGCAVAGGTDWAKNVQYKGTTCFKLAKKQNIFGPGGKDAIPSC
ncbi:MAG: hypothetical protein SVW77_03415 [Candidatus Nanohaloarchaea archaeon]|nr:hypothetical protein [Candidatus Nanohaloarchaea archaeon]